MCLGWLSKHFVDFGWVFSHVWDLADCTLIQTDLGWDEQGSVVLFSHLSPFSRLCQACSDGDGREDTGHAQLCNNFQDSMFSVC